MSYKKYIILIFSLMFLITGCGKSETSKTSSNDTSPSIKKVEFKFNQNQLDFLKTLAIHETNSLEDHGNYKSFTFNGEKFEVYTNENNGITDVKYGKKSAHKVLWNDIKGKIGLIKSERDSFLNDFFNKSNKRYDQANQITWVDSIESFRLGHKGIYTYMGLKGKELTNKKWLRVVLHYSDEDWVFFNRVIFSNKNNAWTYKIPNTFKIRQDVVFGGIHESYDTKLTDIKEGLEIIAYGENPRIDFIGEHYRDGVNLSSYDVNNVKTYLILQEIIDDD